MRKPQKLPLDRLYNELPDNIRENKRLLSFHNGMGVALYVDSSLFRQLKLASSPFLIEDYRMGIVVQGEIHGIINLREYVMREGTMVFITPGSIVQPLDVSDDFRLEGMGLPADRFLMAHNGKLPELFNGKTKDGRKIAAAEDRATLDNMLRLLHELMQRKHTNETIVNSMVCTVSNFFDLLFADGNSDEDSLGNSSSSHQKEIFNKFLRLVNLHGSREHKLSFYADKLCITSRYLGSVVQSTSGVGAKEWIDRAIMSTAKVMLRHSDKQTALIADELCFPNASFFCKYFKRMEGITPLQYRNMGNGRE